MASMNQRRQGPIIVATIALPLLFSAAYLGSYFAMLDPSDVEFGIWVDDGAFPVYRVDGAFVKTIFWPAHQLDRRLLRPNYWHFNGPHFRRVRDTDWDSLDSNRGGRVSRHDLVAAPRCHAANSPLPPIVPSHAGFIASELMRRHLKSSSTLL